MLFGPIAQKRLCGESYTGIPVLFLWRCARNTNTGATAIRFCLRYERASSNFGGPCEKHSVHKSNFDTFGLRVGSEVHALRIIMLWRQDSKYWFSITMLCTVLLFVCVHKRMVGWTRWTQIDGSASGMTSVRTNVSALYSETWESR